MEDKLCDLKHEAINTHLKNHDDMLESHTKEINALTNGQTAFGIEMKNLCEQISSLVSTIKVCGLTMVSILLGFFIWYVQQL